MNVETLLTERIGDAGKRLHTGRSRNDQVALDGRMYVKDAARKPASLQRELLRSPAGPSRKRTRILSCPATRICSSAQPITLGHHMMAYFQMFTARHAAD